MPKNIMMFLVVSLISCNSFQNKSNGLTLNNIDTFVNSDTIAQLKIDSFEWAEVKNSQKILIKMPYADSNNFMHTVLYPCKKCELRKEVACSLILASEIAYNLGFKLLIYDCYRPYSIQVKMYNLINNDQYVAKPGKGSNHNKGCAVDLSLITLKGEELDMGCLFDDFSEKAHYSSSEITKLQANNRKILRDIMGQSGFKPYDKEWWHFNYSNTDFQVSDHSFICE